MTPARAYGGAIASGAALTLAFPEPDLAPLAWVALAPLLLLGQGSRPRRGLALGAAFGLGFFGTLLAWMSIVGWVAWAALVLVQTAFLALFGAAWALVSRRRLGLLLRVVAPAVLWVAIVELLRSIVPLGGFTWGQLAQSQHNAAWLLRPAAWGGGWAVGFLLVVCNALVAQAWRCVRGRPRRAGALLAAGAAVIAAPLALPSNEAEGRQLRVALVQGNVPESFDGSAYAKELAIVRSHRLLTGVVARNHPNVDLVVWPESSLGVDMTSDPAVAQQVAEAARDVAAPIIAGGNIDVGDDRYYVVAFHVSPRGNVEDVYRKTHLVPFGEYVPGRRWLGWISMLDQVPRDALAGSEKTLFTIRGARVAPVLSYEGDFGSLVRARIAGGGRLLIVATNTSTWGRSWASAQHLAFSQVRAAENGVWVVHAAISGISAFVAPDGRVAGSLPLWTAGVLVRDVTVASAVSFYARTGDWLPLACVVVSLMLLVYAARSRARKSPPPEEVEEGLAGTRPGGAQDRSSPRGVLPLRFQGISKGTRGANSKKGRISE